MTLTASPVDWYAARAAGLVAYLLVTTAVCLGLALSGRVGVRRWPRFALEDVHRFAAILAGVFVGVHVLTIAVDAWVPFGVRALVIPFTAAYRPFWTGLGVVAAELLAAVAVTTRLRRRIGRRTWRATHLLAFPVWAAATFHGLGAGTDSGSTPVFLLYVGSMAVVAGLVSWRLTGGNARRSSVTPGRRPLTSADARRPPRRSATAAVSTRRARG